MRLLSVILTIVVILACVVSASATTVSMQIGAYIDGRDQLLICGDQLWWEHFDYALPGRHDGVDPTYITTYVDGVDQNSYTWYPDWPSNTSTALTFAPGLPLSDMPTSFEWLYGRVGMSIVQTSDASNGYVTRFQFDDNGAAGADWYWARINFTVPEPGCLLALLTGMAGMAAYRVRRRR